jgi:hypothetical protein
MEKITPALAKRALAAVDNPPSAPPVASPKRISKKVMAAIDALVAGDCKTISPNYGDSALYCARR